MNAIRWRKTNKIPLKTFSVDLCAITANRANSPEESHRNALLGRGQVRHGRRMGRQLGLRFPAAADRLFTQHHTSPMGMARELFAMTSASPPHPTVTVVIRSGGPQHIFFEVTPTSL